MKINYVIGDATQPVGDGPKMIVHVCNDIGGWGRGFVVAISKRWPEPELRYRAWHSGEDAGVPFELGEVQFVRVSEDLSVANLSAGALGFCDAENPVPALWKITARTGAPKYFPEMHLSGFLTKRFGKTPIFAIEPAGARPLRAAYKWLMATLQPDTVILVDGGTDSLMRGDEAGLATPEGDAVSLLAVHDLENVAQKFLVCLGFGIDAHGGVCHAHFLENVAALSRNEAYLGAWSLLFDSDDFKFYREACEFTFARMPQQPSIVNTSIIAAIAGSFGNVHSTRRTEGSQLFINPLMGFYWSFQLEKVARRNLYLDQIQNTETMEEVALVIERFRGACPSIRPWTTIPC